MLRHAMVLAVCLSGGGCADLENAEPLGDAEGDDSRTSTTETSSSGGGETGPSTTTEGVGGTASSDGSTMGPPETGDDSTSTGEGDSSNESTGSNNCAPDPEPLGGFCPTTCTNDCADNVCEVLCNSPNQCQTIDCPPGFACEVRCEGQEACDGATINCTDLACSVSCSDGNDACGGMHIYCGAEASCSLECLGGAGPCMGTQLHCGSGPCTATCNTDVNPTVNPADSCQLENGCV